MGYTWTDGELITATKLNNTGGGGTSGLCTNTGGTLDKSYNDLLGMLNDGVIPYIVGVEGDTTRVCVLMDVLIDDKYYADFYAKENDTAYPYESATADGYLTYSE